MVPYCIVLFLKASCCQVRKGHLVEVNPKTGEFHVRESYYDMNAYKFNFLVPHGDGSVGILMRDMTPQANHVRLRGGRCELRTHLFLSFAVVVDDIQARLSVPTDGN